MKRVDLGEPTSFLDHVYLGCTQRQCENKQRYCGQLQKICLNPTSLMEQQKSYLILRNLAQTFPHCPTIRKVMQRSVWNDIANCRTKQLNNCTKVATPCIDHHEFKEEELGSVGELSKVFSQIVLKGLHMARIGKADILWFMNKLARAITK